MAIIGTVESLWRELHDGLIFANLGDFDSIQYRRRDAKGFGEAPTPGKPGSNKPE